MITFNKVEGIFYSYTGIQVVLEFIPAIENSERQTTVENNWATTGIQYVSDTIGILWAMSTR